MLTESQKTSIYKWRDTNTDKYREYERNYYATYRLKNRDKEIERCRKHRTYTAESKRLRNILNI
jgi:hypothetical protein